MPPTMRPTVRQARRIGQALVAAAALGYAIAAPHLQPALRALPAVPARALLLLDRPANADSAVTPWQADPAARGADRWAGGRRSGAADAAGAYLRTPSALLAEHAYRFAGPAQAWAADAGLRLGGTRRAFTDPSYVSLAAARTVTGIGCRGDRCAVWVFTARYGQYLLVVVAEYAGRPPGGPAGGSAQDFRAIASAADYQAGVTLTGPPAGGG